MFAGVQESPGHPCHLIGDSDTGLIDPNAHHELPHPGTLGIGFVSDMADNRARAMNQEPSDIAVATFGNPPYACCPAAAMLARDQTQPRCHLSASLKIMAIPQRGDEGRGTQRSNPLHRLQPLTCFHLVAEARELTCDVGNTSIQRTQLTLQALQEVAHLEG